jgi:NADH-ubiquinone oxidoreductase chain 3
MTKITMLFIFVPILVTILLGLNLALAPHQPNESKLGGYECGFVSDFFQTRHKFPIQFLFAGLAFLVFDMELLLAIPIGTSLNQLSLYGLSLFSGFFFILTIGFIFELSSGAITSQVVTFSSNPKNSSANKTTNLNSIHSQKIISKTMPNTNFLMNQNLIFKSIKFGNSLSIRKFTTTSCLYSDKGIPKEVEIKLNAEQWNKLEYSLKEMHNRDISNIDLSRTGAPSPSGAPNLETRLQILNEAPNSETGVKIPSEAPNSETGVKIPSEAPNSETGVKIPNEAPNSETGVKIPSEASDLETGLLVDFPVTSSISDEFKWLYRNGEPLPFHQNVTVFEAVKFVEHFLRVKFDKDINDIPQAKLTEMISIVKDDESVTLLELFNHVAILLKRPDYALEVQNFVAEIQKMNPESDVNSKPFGE